MPNKPNQRLYGLQANQEVVPQIDPKTEKISSELGLQTDLEDPRTVPQIDQEVDPESDKKIDQIDSKVDPKKEKGSKKHTSLKERMGMSTRMGVFLSIVAILLTGPIGLIASIILFVPVFKPAEDVDKQGQQLQDKGVGIEKERAHGGHDDHRASVRDDPAPSTHGDKSPTPLDEHPKDPSPTTVSQHEMKEEGKKSGGAEVTGQKKKIAPVPYQEYKGQQPTPSSGHRDDGEKEKGAGR